ncbi:MAG: hypothetical protein ABI970_13775, partial [Chloroflexota bacterium]
TLSLIPDPAANAATIEPTLTAVVMVATSNSVPDGMVAFQPTSAPSPTTNQSIAMVSTGAPVVMESGVLPPTSSTPPWLVIALGVQMVVLVSAGVEYIRRHWKR